MQTRQIPVIASISIFLMVVSLGCRTPETKVCLQRDSEKERISEEAIATVPPWKPEGKDLLESYLRYLESTVKSCPNDQELLSKAEFYRNLAKSYPPQRKLVTIKLERLSKDLIAATLLNNTTQHFIFGRSLKEAVLYFKGLNNQMWRIPFVVKRMGPPERSGFGFVDLAPGTTFNFQCQISPLAKAGETFSSQGFIALKMKGRLDIHGRKPTQISTEKSGERELMIESDRLPVPLVMISGDEGGSQKR